MRNWYIFLGSKFNANKTKSFSRTITRLAIAIVAFSVALMILSIGIVSEFQATIKNKIIGLGGDIILESNLNSSNGEQLILNNQDKEKISALIDKTVEGTVHFILNKPCILRGKTEIEGMVARAVDNTYDFTSLKSFLTAGKLPQFAGDSNCILISNTIANKVGIKLNSRVQLMFFYNDSVSTRARAINPKVIGFYNTGIADFDNQIAFVSVRNLQRILKPNESFSQVSIYTNSNQSADEALHKISEKMDVERFQIKTAKQYYWIIFEWLKILDKNVWLILGIMVLVTAIGMCTTVLILITERTNTIGMLKALGADNTGLMGLFLSQALRICFYGILLGNSMALLFGFIQIRFKVLKLDPTSYFVDHVVLNFNFATIMLINLATIALIAIVMLLPVSIISKFSPVKSIRFN